MTDYEQNILHLAELLAQRKKANQVAQQQLYDNCAKLAEYIELYGPPVPGVGMELPLR